jgi:hypothetical protein
MGSRQLVMGAKVSEKISASIVMARFLDYIVKTEETDSSETLCLSTAHDVTCKTT